MSGLTTDEANALLEPGLQVDPTAAAPSMEAVGAPVPQGNDASPELIAAREEYGEEVTNIAYGHGWRPKGEHAGNPENWINPAEFLGRYAQTADKRARRQADAEAERRLAGIAQTVEKRLENLTQRVDKVDEADKAATTARYAEMIAAAGGDVVKVEELIKQRDKALADIDAAGVVDNESNEKIDPATIKFFEDNPSLRDPQTADDHADRAWAGRRAAELEAKYPNATLEQVFNQVSHDLRARKTKAPDPAPGRGRTLSDDNNLPGGGTSSDNGGQITVSTMTADHRAAFDTFVRMGVYQDNDEGRKSYVEGLNEALAEEAMKNG